MSSQWKVVEAKSDFLQNRLNELQSAGYEIVKVDLLIYNEQLQLARYLIIARRSAAVPMSPAYVTVQ